MGKKRKAGGRPYGESKAPKDEDSKMRVTTFEDVADSEDEFHINRDKILLEEEPSSKRLKKWKEQEEFLQPSDEEVLDYDDISEDDEENYDEDDDDAEVEDTESGAAQRQQRAEDDGDDDLGGWGPSKKDYYDADAIETEQDALDEEAEARRIQKKQLQSMTEADFGFDEDEWMDQEKEGESGKVVTEVLPQLQITDDMTEEEKLKILHSRYPEFEPIRQEFLRLQPLHDELKSAANAAQKLAKSRALKSGKANGDLPPTPSAVTKYWACASYIGAMCMYFAMLTSTAKDDDSPTIAMDPTELHEHPVMETLLKCQKVWTRVEKLPVADPMVETSNDELSVIEEASPVAGPQAEADAERALKRKEKKKLKRSKAQLAAEIAQGEADARRAAKLAQTEQELADLEALTDMSALRKAAKLKKAQKAPKLNLTGDADDSDFGEETSLTAHELAEKAKRKKSLRFYTSQITQKANKRGAAGRDQGGDVDIPHRERLKDRQARLQAEAEKRGQNTDKSPGVALGDDVESDGDNEAAAPMEDEDGYYDLVAARSKAKKADKAERAAAYAQASKEKGIVVPEEVIGADGKRKITYAIAKNKGLTPHRKKEVRNPRVKKKLKYEDKKKKLRSMKSVYGGGEGRGGYQGELTGIKSNLIRSVKL